VKDGQILSMSTHSQTVSRRDARIRRFLQKPWREKANSLHARWNSSCSRWAERISNIPVPIRLPFGAWWIRRNDTVGEPLRAGTFEPLELSFVRKFLQTGMTVLDLGAHHGLYTLLASKLVGSRGRVIAFEPSPRERRALQLHLILNQCKNVDVQELALSDEDKESDLYVVEAWASGCNSLRPPEVPARTTPVRVHVARLDSWLLGRKMVHVDFIKMDVEGGELSLLKGAEKFLKRRPRPVILVEVQDIRTQSWGYRAKEIIEHLKLRGFTWLRLSSDGFLEELDVSADQFEGNFVACPEERKEALLLAQASRVFDVTGTIKI
jgi:FkbM family methyltransferase